MSLVKAAWKAPLYVSVAWTLMISYQLFTQTAVATILTYVNMFWPSAGVWLTLRMDMIVFIHAFAWVFVLSSVIPSIILGKERSVLIQFFVCLALTVLAFEIQNILTVYADRPIDQISSLAVFFQNPFLAVAYLAMPYLFMIMLDIYARKKQRKKKELEKTAEAYLDTAIATEQKLQEAE